MRTSMGFVAIVLMTVAGCEEEPIQVGRGVQAERAQPEAAPPAPSGASEAPAAELPDAGIQPAQYRDEDFVEADTNRDPFRPFASLFRPETPALERTGRDVVMPETSIDEMRVIGIVTGMPNPRAMLIDREGVGHTVRRGEYVGRSEVVQTGGTESLPVTLNWRVDRIRADEIVLIREDPTAPNRPPLTRVIPLRTEQDSASWGAVRTAGATVR